jgi:nitroreductase
MKDKENIFNTIPDLKHVEDFRPVSHEAFDNIVQNRRSVRVYTDEKIPAEIVEKVLDWALLAPNSSNLQCWEFYWVKHPVKKAKLIEALFSQPAASTAQELIVVVAKLETWKENRKQMLEIFKKSETRIPKSAVMYYEKLVPVAYTLGPLGVLGPLKRIVMAVTGLFRPIPRQPKSKADIRVWANKSTALACENIMLGFSAFGYDTCPMEGYDSVRVKKVLELGSDSEICMVISAGKRAPNGIYGPRIRFSKEQFVKVL